MQDVAERGPSQAALRTWAEGMVLQRERCSWEHRPGPFEAAVPPIWIPLEGDGGYTGAWPSSSTVDRSPVKGRDHLGGKLS